MFVAVGAILLFFKLFIPTFYRDSGSPPWCIALPFGIPAGLLLGRIADQVWKPKKKD